MSPLALTSKNVNWHCGNKSKKENLIPTYLNLGLDRGLGRHQNGKSDLGLHQNNNTA